MDPLMIPTAIVASLGAGSGVWAAVQNLRRTGNGHSKNGSSQGEPPPSIDKQDLEKLMGAYNRSMIGISDRLAVIAEKQANPLVIREPQPNPEWVAALETRLAAHTAALVESKEGGSGQAAVSLLERVVERLNAIEDRLCAVLEMGPPPLLEVGERVELITLIRAVAQLPGEIEESIGQLSKQQNESERKLLTAVKSSGGSPPPPPRRAPEPRAIPNPLPPIPHIPPPYFGGTITLSGGSPQNLLLLIQQQAQPNCPGACVQLRLTADAEVFVGSASFLGGPLSVDNYAYVLEPGQERLYKSAYPGSSCPLGDLQVLGSGALHIEVQL